MEPAIQRLVVVENGHLADGPVGEERHVLREPLPNAEEQQQEQENAPGGIASPTMFHLSKQQR
jgi:hypothetical protein